MFPIDTLAETIQMLVNALQIGWPLFVFIVFTGWAVRVFQNQPAHHEQKRGSS